MREIPRTIDEVRELRGDLSSWLVHLTKDNAFTANGQTVQMTAKACLESILRRDEIVAVNPVGHFRWNNWYPQVNADALKGVCLTETPLDQIYLFIAITGKNLKFSSYGLVFDWESVSKAPNFAAPVVYISQPDGNLQYVNHLRQMGNAANVQPFQDFLFLFDTFGETTTRKKYNFRWEREWRVKGNLLQVNSLVKFGLCPESEIQSLEQSFPAIPFVDPFFTPKQIEAKLKLRGVIP